MCCRQESRKIFVGGLNPEVTENEFREYFSKFGGVKDAVIMFDRNTNRSRGFGFVTFEDEAGVEAVIQTKEHELAGKWMDVKRAEPRDSRLLLLYFDCFRMEIFSYFVM